MGTDAQAVATAYENAREDLVRFLARMVVRLDVAEELAQTTAMRAIEHVETAPKRPDELRPWLFRIATNLALDERKRHGRWRETLLDDIKAHGKSDPVHRERVRLGRGTPELHSIAREHLSFCFACTMTRLSGEQAAALLLREVFGFDRTQTAAIVGADETLVKNRLQTARATMRAAYEGTCALVTKQGTCYQCAELDEAFGTGARRDPLEGADGRFTARLRVIQEQSPATWTHWLTELLRSLETG